MFKKYRILEIGESFYPQWRTGFWGIWAFYGRIQSRGNFDIHEHILFDSLKEAKKYIKNNERKYHKVDL